MTVSNIERQIAIAFVYSAEFIQRIRSHLDFSLISSGVVRDIVRIGLRVWERIGRVVGDEFLNHLEVVGRKVDVEALETFFSSIDVVEKNIDPVVLFHDAVTYFAQQKLQLLIRELETADVETAQRILDTFKMPKPTTHDPVPILDEYVVEQMFRVSEPLFTYDGELGRLLNKFLVRDAFLAILAPEKRGKTWFLIEFAMRAVRAGCKVAFFEVGDMSLNQLRRRFVSYVMKRPFAATTVLWPKWDCVKNQQNTCMLGFRDNAIGVVRDERETILVDETLDSGYSPCVVCREMKRWFPVTAFPEMVKVKPISIGEIREVAGVWDEIIGKYGGDIRLFTASANTLSVGGIHSILQEGDTVDEWRPDVVIIDYADILAPDQYFGEYRHQVNAIWARLRRLSLDWNCLVITATQSNVRGHKTTLLDQLNFSEDKRKMAHVTAMIGLNQTKEEKQLGLMRVNVIVAREVEYDVAHYVPILTGFGVGRPILENF